VISLAFAAVLRRGSEPEQLEVGLA
jgi:hypothetical protein